MEFSRPKRKQVEINIIPLINVIFLLLVFFMVAGRVDKVDMFDIAVPVAKNSFTEMKTLPTIYISKDGNIVVNDDAVAKRDFKTILTTLLLDDPDQEIMIKSDARVEAKQLIWIMQKIEESGGTNVSLITQVAR